MATKNGKLIITLIIIFGILLYFNNKSRAVDGITSWFSDPTLITMGSIYYVLFFGLVTGYVIARLLGKK
jgi:hypothetical protein